MDIFRATILGIIQGATEFLPVSSSGNLVIYPAMFKWGTPTLSFVMALHMGTFFAVFLYYIKDVWRLILAFFNTFKKNRNKEEDAYVRLFWMLFIALIPAGIVGILYADKIGDVFSEPHVVSIFLFITAAILILSSIDFRKKWDNIENVGLKHALSIGFIQIAALFPGISRSGSTIAGGVFSGLNREDAARFSFLLSIPTIGGAGLLEMKNALNISISHVSHGAILAGFTASFVVGFLSIGFFFKVIKRTKFYYFAIYCILLGILGLIFA
jgi:undecaprenyl-diphosphatase